MDFKKMEPAGADIDTTYPEKELDVPAASDNAVAPSSGDSVTALVLASTLEKAINQEPLKEKQKKIAYEFGLNALFNPERLHPRIEFLIYWRDLEKSGMVFGAGLIALMAFAQFSIISLLSSLLLIAMLGCFAVRVYASVVQDADISEEDDQFKKYLELDLTLSPERVHHLTVVAVDHINYFIAQLRSLFLFEDVFESLHFGLTLGSLTILGGMFNGMTLIILAFISLFTLPKIYETNKEDIDAKLDSMRLKWAQVIDKIRGVVPDDSNMLAAPEAVTDK